MVDLYLEAMMKGKSPSNNSNKKNDNFDEAFEKYLNDYIETLSVDEDNNKNSLTTPEIKKARLKEEAKEALAMNWIAPHLTNAFEILSHEGHIGIDSAQDRLLLDEFELFPEKLNQLRVENVLEGNYQQILQISDVSMESLWEIAQAKYNGEEYQDSLALFALLSTLNSDEPEYWLRMGIAAYRNEEFTLALRVFEIVTDLDPGNLGARLMEAECYLRKDQHAKAEAEYLEAKQIADDIKADGKEIDEIWAELFIQMSIFFK